MPKKKIKSTDPVRPEGYDIFIGFIKSFTFYNPETATEMNGHPAVGGVYRIIKSPKGYRINIGRDKTPLGIDGLLLGEKLKNKTENWSFNIVEVTRENFLSLSLPMDKMEQVAAWMESDHEDLWKTVADEINDSTMEVSNIGDLIKLVEAQQKEIQELRANEGEHIGVSVLTTGENLAMSLNTISEKEPEAFYAILSLLEYIAGTYSEKYENSGMPNVTKPLLVESKVGATMNTYAIMKYAQRYITTGHAKSYNITDMYKILHYGLFEVQRRQHNND